MTEVLEHLQSRNERLITIPRRDPISNYCIGEYEYNRCGVSCRDTSISTLYEKLCCGNYNSEYQETYKLLADQTCELVQSSTLSVGKDEIEDYVIGMYFSATQNGDQTFHDHVNDEYSAPKNDSPNKSKIKDLARLWLFYLAERGVEFKRD